MTATVVPLMPRDLSRFGLCPECGEQQGPVHCAEAQWFYCEQHKVKWLAGVRCIGGWQTIHGLEELYYTGIITPFRQIDPCYPDGSEPDGPGTAA